MKKSLILFWGVLFAALPMSSGFAQSDVTDTDAAVADATDMVRGRIVSIDPVKNQVVIHRLSNDEEMTFTVTSDQIANITVDERVRVKFNPETKVAESIQSTVFKKDRWVINEKATNP